MKVRKRITIAFTGLYSLLIIPLSVIIFISVYTTRKNTFFNQLSERVEITERFFLESARLSDELKDQMRRNFLKTLPNEIEYAEKVDSFRENIPDSVLKFLSPTIVPEKLGVGEELSWTKGQKQGVARKYRVDSEDYIVLVIAEDVTGHQFVNNLGIILFIASLLTISLAFLMSNIISKSILKPIANKINRANRISADNLDVRLTVYNENDELGMLAISFNNLLDRIEKAFELEKNFVRFASHEIKNPLAVIIGESELALSSNRSSTEYIEALEKVNKRANSLNHFIDQFLQLSKLESKLSTYERFRIDEVMLDVISVSDPYTDIHYDIDLKVAPSLIEEDLVVSGKESLIKTALINLLSNAKKFSEADGAIMVDIYKKDQRLFLTISDEGVGIREEDLEFIFQPLFRASNTAEVEGTGLGLAVTKKILDIHNIQVRVDSELGKGTTFELQF